MRHAKEYRNNFAYNCSLCELWVMCLPCWLPSAKQAAATQKALLKDACCRLYVTEKVRWNALFMKELHVLTRSNTMLLRSTSTASVISEVSSRMCSRCGIRNLLKATSICIISLSDILMRCGLKSACWKIVNSGKSLAASAMGLRFARVRTWYVCRKNFKRTTLSRPGFNKRRRPNVGNPVQFG